MKWNGNGVNIMETTSHLLKWLADRKIKIHRTENQFDVAFTTLHTPNG